jgi:hypothetical protein
MNAFDPSTAKDCHSFEDYLGRIERRLGYRIQCGTMADIVNEGYWQGLSVETVSVIASCLHMEEPS